jgi:ABC-type transporter lipoprotein component MlaA
MKDIEKCSLDDLYELFEIMELNETNLKIARKKVLLLHPDKNIGVDTSDYYEYFRNAYLKLEKISHYVNINKSSNTSVSSLPKILIILLFAIFFLSKKNELSILSKT